MVLKMLFVYQKKLFYFNIFKKEKYYILKKNLIKIEKFLNKDKIQEDYLSKMQMSGVTICTIIKDKIDLRNRQFVKLQSLFYQLQ